jgi:hypothetical protein
LGPAPARRSEAHGLAVAGKADDKLPDFFRYIEWAREFDNFVQARNLPNLTLLRLMNDHIDAFARAIRGVNTPELQVANNDYAVGLVIDKVAHSRYATSTSNAGLLDGSAGRGGR